MIQTDLVLTGIAAISANGVVGGATTLHDGAGLQTVTRWPTQSPRRAFLVPPLRADQFVPGLRTRRMDRLSVWAMLGAGLALRDAGIEIGHFDQNRHAVVCGTALGCLDLAGQFLGTGSTMPWVADPILFPETLSNQPGSHVARHFGLRGPNLTVAAGDVSGEVALCQAATLLRTGQADCVLVLAGDELTQSAYEWYEAAGLLDAACFGDVEHPVAARPGAIIPGEGMAACVLETAEAAEKRGARSRADFLDGWFGPAGSDLAGTRQAALARIGKSRCAAVRQVPTGEFGMFGGAGLLTLAAALGRVASDTPSPILIERTGECGGQSAAVLVALKQ